MCDHINHKQHQIYILASAAAAAASVISTAVSRMDLRVSVVWVTTATLPPTPGSTPPLLSVVICGPKGTLIKVGRPLGLLEQK